MRETNKQTSNKTTVQSDFAEAWYCIKTTVVTCQLTLTPWAGGGEKAETGIEFSQLRHEGACPIEAENTENKGRDTMSIN